MDLLERIDSWARTAPDHAVHVSGERTLTYGDLTQRSDALAAHLAGALPDDKSPIAVVGHKEPEMLVAFLGAVKAGHPYVPLDTSIPPQRIERIVAVAGAKLTLTPEEVAALTTTAAAAPAHRVGPSDPYYIIFTSGSTGEPKGVVITLGCLTDFVTWTLAEQKFAERQETFLNQAPFSFDLSVMDLYLSLATGGTLFSVTNEQIANPKQLYHAFAASGVTTWVSTPSFAQMCLAERTFAAPMLPRLRRFWFCGETLPPEVAAQLLERFPQAQVWNTYGPTEATCATTSVQIDHEVLRRYSPLPVGYVKPGTRILIMDEDGKPLPSGERGEIVIAGPNVSTGYLGRPDLTAQAFFTSDGERAYRTGDWGQFQDDLLFFDGRMDDQIKLHGYRIELADVEANLRALAGIRDAVVIPSVKNGKPDSLAAFVILSERPVGSDFAVSRALRTQLGERLPSYMLPRKFVFVEIFPMTPNGKADRRRLEALLR
jgi:D-alanine--poly(phosphoribitol) ligase subunit 1